MYIIFITVIFDALSFLDFCEDNFFIRFSKCYDQDRHKIFRKFQGFFYFLRSEIADHAAAQAHLRGPEEDGVGADAHVLPEPLDPRADVGVIAQNDEARGAVAGVGQGQLGEIPGPVSAGLESGALLLPAD